MQHDVNQKLDIPLSAIVPEYQSKNPIVRWLFRKRLHVALDYLFETKAVRIADIGCGDGSFIKLLHAAKFPYQELWGLDLNPSVLSLAGDFPRAVFQVEHLGQTHFADQTLDAIVCLDTLEHIADLSQPLREYQRILKPGGYLITSEPVESVLYKSLRFILKGTYSQESGPGAGVHYHNARQIDTIISQKGFHRKKMKRIPLPWPFDLFLIALYQRNP
jgi:2-polyprenyl-3-methyl-5-hydroxy-6-metoxy-1,4-benzoquinol methylase